MLYNYHSILSAIIIIIIIKVYLLVKFHLEKLLIISSISHKLRVGSIQNSLVLDVIKDRQEGIKVGMAKIISKNAQYSKH